MLHTFAPASRKVFRQVAPSSSLKSASLTLIPALEITRLKSLANGSECSIVSAESTLLSIFLSCFEPRGSDQKHNFLATVLEYLLGQFWSNTHNDRNLLETVPENSYLVVVPLEYCLAAVLPLLERDLGPLGPFAAPRLVPELGLEAD